MKKRVIVTNMILVLFCLMTVFTLFVGILVKENAKENIYEEEHDSSVFVLEMCSFLMAKNVWKGEG